MTCAIMHIEKKLDALGLTLMDLDRAYRANASGARFVSHLAVGNLLYLSGTTPVRYGFPSRVGVVPERYSTLSTARCETKRAPAAFARYA